MHPDRGIFRMDICPDGLSTIKDGPNNLTRQSVYTNDAPQGPDPSAPLQNVQLVINLLHLYVGLT